MATDNGHAILSPSAAHRWIPCPGSVAANAAIPEDKSTSNPDADLGTAAHELLEICLLTGLGTKADEYLGYETENGYTVDNDMADAVQVALDWLEDYVEEWGEENVVVYTERRLAIGKSIGVTDKLCNGTSDIIIEHVDGSRLVVADYKHGRGIKVYAKDNDQMLMYAIGARQEHGRKFKEYVLVIIQPRANKRHAIDEWKTTDPKINKYIKIQVAPAATAALLPNAPRTAGEHCRWCRAAAGCNTYRAKARATAEVEFSPIEDKVVHAFASEESLDHLTVEQYAEILDEAQVLENWIHAVRAHALRLVQNNVQIPGYALGWTQRRRVWSATKQKELRAYLRRQGIPQEQYMQSELLSPAQMLKLLKEYRVVPTRIKKGEQKSNPLDAFTDLSMPSPKLVQTDAESDFDEIDE